MQSQDLMNLVLSMQKESYPLCFYKKEDENKPLKTRAENEEQ